MGARLLNSRIIVRERDLPGIITKLVLESGRRLCG